MEKLVIFNFIKSIFPLDQEGCVWKKSLVTQSLGITTLFFSVSEWLNAISSIIIILIVAGLDNAGRKIPRKTKYNEVTIYFFLFLCVKNSQSIPINNKNNCRIVSWNGNRFYSQALAISCCFPKSATKPF